MGAVLTKHIQTAEIVTIEDDNPDKIDHFQNSKQNWRPNFDYFTRRWAGMHN